MTYLERCENKFGLRKVTMLLFCCYEDCCLVFKKVLNTCLTKLMSYTLLLRYLSPAHGLRRLCILVALVVVASVTFVAVLLASLLLLSSINASFLDHFFQLTAPEETGTTSGWLKQLCVLPFVSAITQLSASI